MKANTSKHQKLLSILIYARLTKKPGQEEQSRFLNSGFPCSSNLACSGRENPEYLNSAKNVGDFSFSRRYLVLAFLFCSVRTRFSMFVSYPPFIAMARRHKRNLQAVETPRRDSFQKQHFIGSSKPSGKLNSAFPSSGRDL